MITWYEGRAWSVIGPWIYHQCGHFCGFVSPRQHGCCHCVGRERDDLCEICTLGR